MKNLAITLSAVVLSMGAAVAVAEPALVINTITEDVGMFTGDGDLVFTSCREVTVATNSKRGTIASTCHATVANSTGRAQKFTPDDHPFSDEWGEFPCGIMTSTGLFFTYQWKQHISASGKSNLQCLYKDE